MWINFGFFQRDYVTAAREKNVNFIIFQINRGKLHCFPVFF